MNNHTKHFSLLGESNGEIENSPIPYHSIALNYSEIEQLKFAIQNRDEKALHLLVSEKSEDGGLRSKDYFISNFISYCKKLEKKHGKLFIQTLPGKCASSICSKFNKSSKSGISVSVNAVKYNKQIWVFDLLCSLDENGQLILSRCHEMIVCKEHV